MVPDRLGEGPLGRAVGTLYNLEKYCTKWLATPSVSAMVCPDGVLRACMVWDVFFFCRGLANNFPALLLNS